MRHFSILEILYQIRHFLAENRVIESVFTRAHDINKLYHLAGKCETLTSDISFKFLSTKCHEVLLRNIRNRTKVRLRGALSQDKPLKA